MHRTTYHRPRTLDEAHGLKAKIRGSSYIAGGTSLVVQMNNGLRQPSALISLRSIPEIGELSVGESAIIGAGVPIARLLEHRHLRGGWPLLAEALRAFGSAQVRNVATLGGNLGDGHPAADSVPALLVLGTRVTVAGAAGTRQVPLGELFTGDGETCLGAHEILTAITVDAPPAGSRATYRKKTWTRVDRALASTALMLEWEGKVCRSARVAVGAVAPTPRRLPRIEEMLTGQEVTKDLVLAVRDAVREDVEPRSDLRASADYRRHVTGVLVARALEEIIPGGTP